MPANLALSKKLVQRSDRVKSVDLHPQEPWVLCGLYTGKAVIYNYNNNAVVKSIDVSELPVRCVVLAGPRPSPALRLRTRGTPRRNPQEPARARVLQRARRGGASAASPLPWGAALLRCPFSPPYSAPCFPHPLSLPHALPLPSPAHLLPSRPSPPLPPPFSPAAPSSFPASSG